MVVLTLRKSPLKAKKFRVVFEDGTHTDFGASGYSDYTIHKSPERMRAYINRHGGKIKTSTREETDPNKIHDLMLHVKESRSESWGKDGIGSAGFWSRWLLWSMPSIPKAISLIESEFKVKINYFPRLRGCLNPHVC